MEMVPLGCFRELSLSEVSIGALLRCRSVIEKRLVLSVGRRWCDETGLKHVYQEARAPSAYSTSIEHGEFTLT